jgi:hypothetical protein
MWEGSSNANKGINKNLSIVIPAQFPPARE